jgi:hypothetical protein
LIERFKTAMNSWRRIPEVRGSEQTRPRKSPAAPDPNDGLPDRPRNPRIIDNGTFSLLADILQAFNDDLGKNWPEGYQKT